MWSPRLRSLCLVTWYVKLIFLCFPPCLCWCSTVHCWSRVTAVQIFGNYLTFPLWVHRSPSVPIIDTTALILYIKYEFLRRISMDTVLRYIKTPLLYRQDQVSATYYYGPRIAVTIFNFSLSSISMTSQISDISRFSIQAVTLCLTAMCFMNWLCSTLPHVDGIWKNANSFTSSGVVQFAVRQFNSDISKRWQNQKPNTFLHMRVLSAFCAHCRLEELSLQEENIWCTISPVEGCTAKPIVPVFTT